MTTLLEAIRRSDLATVRELLRIDADVPKQQNAIDIVLSTAKRISNDFIDMPAVRRVETALVLKFNWTGVYTMEELRQLLVALVSELSEDCYAAGWMRNIEFELWQIIHADAGEPTLMIWQNRGDREAVQDLNSLHEITQSWAVWSNGTADPVPISLGEWNKVLHDWMTGG